MTHQNKDLIIFGKRSTGKEIAEFLSTSDSYSFDKIEMIHFSEELEDSEIWQQCINSKRKFHYIISFSDINLRKKCLAFISKFESFEAISIIHDKAFVSPSASLGKGVYVAPNATISTDAVINNHVIINLNASVGHDAVIDENSIILTGARISGNCQIGKGTLVGSNAFVYNGVKVGYSNLIDALTYIDKDLKPKQISSSKYTTKTFRRIG